MRLRHTAAMLSLCLALPIAPVLAAPEDIVFPEEFKESFLLYSVHNRPDNGQVRDLYANAVAAEGAKKGGMLPDGSVLLVAAFEAQKDADGNFLEGPEGHFLKGPLKFYTVMEKRAGWGDPIPEELRNGDWSYAVFTTEGKFKAGMKQDNCLACHKSLLEADYVFSYDELVDKAGYQPVMVAEAAPGPMSGDAERGKVLFKRCSNCHTTDSSGKHKVGPNLQQVVGRQAASAEGYRYSKALEGLDVAWNAKNLDAWLSGPRKFAKGTKMAFPGFRKPQDRADVIAYLDTLK